MALYTTGAAIARDEDFKARATMAAAQIGIPYPEAWVGTHLHALALDQPIGTAYEASLQNAPYHSRRCYDPSIITDAMILAVVTALWEAEQAALAGEPTPSPESEPAASPGA